MDAARGVATGGHVHPTFATGRSWDWYKSYEFLQGRGRYITYAWGLRNLQTAENEANLLLPLRIQKLKGFRLQGDFAPLTSWPGALPLDPAGGSAPRPPLYARAPRSPCVSTPHILTWRRPWTLHTQNENSNKFCYACETFEWRRFSSFSRASAVINSTRTSLCSASHLGCQRDTARTCCWAPGCGAVAAERACSRFVADMELGHWVIGSPGQWVIWVIFHVRVTGSSFWPGVRAEFSGFRKNAQNAKRTFEMLKWQMLLSGVCLQWTFTFTYDY